MGWQNPQRIQFLTPSKVLNFIWTIIAASASVSMATALPRDFLEALQLTNELADHTVTQI